MEIPSCGNTAISCSESGTGNVAAGGLVSANVSLNCVFVGGESACEIKPVSYSVNGKYESPLNFIGLVIHDLGKCTWPEEVKFSGPSGTIQYGSEAVSMNVVINGTAKYGSNTVTLYGNSQWTVSGSNVGKKLGFW
jgi:hypothetical protein